MEKILLIGSGNIGSRHLQALCQSDKETVIEIIENNEEAINLTKNRLNEINFSNQKIKLIWKKTIHECSENSNLVIVATLSSGRANIIKNLLEKNHSRFIIEKMVCQSETEYKSILTNIKKYNAIGWVNTRCRYFEFYQEIKSRLKLNPIHLAMTSSFTGLGTGAIHYIDLFNWITETNDIKLGGEMLLPNILSNKRSKELVEFSGLINGSSEVGSISISHFPEKKVPQIISISGQEGHITVDETNGKILNASKKFADMQFKVEYISNITSKIIKDIMETNQCLLPTVQDSYHSHIELFQIFNKHLEKLKNQKITLCPIT
jgi:predicted dehydrogenase